MALKQTPKRLDSRDCPKCRSLGWDDAKIVRMERKAGLYNDWELWQCPDCKNVEVL